MNALAVVSYIETISEADGPTAVPISARHSRSGANLLGASCTSERISCGRAKHDRECSRLKLPLFCKPERPVFPSPFENAQRIMQARKPKE